MLEVLSEMMTTNLCFERILVEELVKSFRMRLVKIVNLKNFLNMLFLIASLVDLISDDEISDDKIDDDELVNSTNETSRSGKML